MLFRSRTLLLLAATAFALVAQPLTAGAAETASSDLVVIREDVVIEDDLYATGLRVLIEGEVAGDLVAFAAEEIIITGVVSGSVLAVAQDVTVSGEVGGSLRASAVTVDVTGDIGGDLVVAAGSLTLGDGSTVGKDVLAWALGAAIDSNIRGDLTATTGGFRLEGSVGGDADVTVSGFDVTGPLHVGGDLAYRSSREGNGLDDVETGGVLVKKAPLPPNIRVRALGLLGRALIGVFLTAAAVLVAFGWPRRLSIATGVAGTRWARSFLLGLGILLSPVLILGIAALIFFLAPASTSLPLLAFFVPVALALVGVVLLFSLIAGAPVVHLVGTRLFGRLGTYGAIVAGSAIIGIVWLLPAIGWVTPVIVLPWGAGSWLLALRSGAESQESMS